MRLLKILLTISTLSPKCPDESTCPEYPSQTTSPSPECPDETCPESQNSCPASSICVSTGK